MCAKSYTQYQIFSGLWIFLREDYGCKSPFDPDSRLDDYFMAERIWDELDTGELACEMSKFFGFSCSLDEWEKFFGWSANARDVDGWELLFAPHFTFRGLADFIRERMERIPLEPLDLLGKPCLTAGIFRGLERIARQINPNVRRFAPSTPIYECLSGWHRHALWRRLRWITEERIPDAPIIQIFTGHFNRSLFLKIGIGILIAIWHYGLPGLFIGLGLGLITTYGLVLILAFIVESINLRINPLPKEIQTFGDLARYLAIVTENQRPQGA